MKNMYKTLVIAFALFLSTTCAFAAETATETSAKPAGTLYERLGGKSAIEAVVADFVSRAAANPAVNFTRKGTKREWAATPENVGKLKTHLVQFVCMATGGDDKYEGREMKETHQGMGISEAEFNALANDLKISLSRFGVSDADQEELLKIVGTTKGAIVEVSAPATIPTPAVEQTEVAPFAQTEEASKAAPVAEEIKEEAQTIAVEATEQADDTVAAPVAAETKAESEAVKVTTEI